MNNIERFVQAIQTQDLGKKDILGVLQEEIELTSIGKADRLQIKDIEYDTLHVEEFLLSEKGDANSYILFNNITYRFS